MVYIFFPWPLKTIQDLSFPGSSASTLSHVALDPPLVIHPFLPEDSSAASTSGKEGNTGSPKQLQEVGTSNPAIRIHPGGCLKLQDLQGKITWLGIVTLTDPVSADHEQQDSKLKLSGSQGSARELWLNGPSSQKGPGNKHALKTAISRYFQHHDPTASHLRSDRSQALLGFSGVDAGLARNASLDVVLGSEWAPIYWTVIIPRQAVRSIKRHDKNHYMTLWYFMIL